MSRLKPGQEAPTPKGFRETVMVDGHTVNIKYFKSLREGSKYLDGFTDPELNLIMLATGRRHPARIADNLYHELIHFAIQRWVKDNGNPSRVKQLTVEEIEQIVLLMESYNSQLLRGNAWFHKLYQTEVLP